MKESVFIEVMFFNENKSIDLLVPQNLSLGDLIRRASQYVGSQSDAEKLKAFSESDKRWLNSSLSVGEEGIGDGNLLIVRSVSDSI